MSAIERTQSGSSAMDWDEGAEGDEHEEEEDEPEAQHTEDEMEIDDEEDDDEEENLTAKLVGDEIKDDPDDGDYQG